MLRDPAFLADPAQHKPRAKRETDARHLAFVRTLPCCACKRPASVAVIHAHHIMRGVVRGMGMRAADRWAISLCDICHSALHAHGDETEFLALLGIDGPALAAALYSVSGDFKEAVRILG